MDEQHVVRPVVALERLLHLARFDLVIGQARDDQIGLGIQSADTPQ